MLWKPKEVVGTSSFEISMARGTAVVMMRQNGGCIVQNLLWVAQGEQDERSVLDLVCCREDQKRKWRFAT